MGVVMLPPVEETDRLMAETAGRARRSPMRALRVAMVGGRRTEKGGERVREGVREGGWREQKLRLRSWGERSSILN